MDLRLPIRMALIILALLILILDCVTIHQLNKTFKLTGTLPWPFSDYLSVANVSLDSPPDPSIHDLDGLYCLWILSDLTILIKYAFLTFARQFHCTDKAYHLGMRVLFLLLIWILVWWYPITEIVRVRRYTMRMYGSLNGGHGYENAIMDISKTMTNDSASHVNRVAYSEATVPPNPAEERAGTRSEYMLTTPEAWKRDEDYSRYKKDRYYDPDDVANGDYDDVVDSSEAEETNQTKNNNAAVVVVPETLPTASAIFQVVMPVHPREQNQPQLLRELRNNNNNIRPRQDRTISCSKPTGEVKGGHCLDSDNHKNHHHPHRRWYHPGVPSASSVYFCFNNHLDVAPYAPYIDCVVYRARNVAAFLAGVLFLVEIVGAFFCGEFTLR
ncbi:hypothetical protein BGZ83_004733 [Gryganskiella cystojenkinii]|nr:hypothetical protein BGZ83_004733 [Gryganskiella cystojenkinii]